MPPEFLYFDLGNVLMHFDNERMCRQMAAAAGVPERAVADLLMPTGGGEGDPQWRFEAGGFTEDAYYEFFCKSLSVAPDREALEHACADMFAPIEATHDLADRLKAAGYRLGLLSNTNAWHWKFLLNGQWPTLVSAFAVRVTSFHSQSMKPGGKIYRDAIAAAGVEPGAIFFTDDKPENVAAAKQRGIDAVVFTSTEQLIEDLRTRGITTAAG